MVYSFSRFFTPGIAATVAMHATFGWALLRFDGVPRAAAAAPVMISLVDSAGETRVTAPPKPKVKPLSQPPPPEALPESSALPEAIASTAPAEPAADETPALESSITLPRFDADYLNNPPPVYPALARRLGEQGRVMLRVLVHADGTPTDVTINRSSGSWRLDRAALEAVRQWRFVPARRGDTPVAAPVLVPIAFTLEG